MKHIVFDSWLFMAVVAPGALRVRTLETLHFLIQVEDFFRATFSTHAPARGP